MIDDPTHADDLPAERPSKSAVKREFAAIQALVRRLAALPPAQLARLPLDADTREAVAVAGTLKRQAYERQVRHASGLLARIDWQGVAAAADALARPQREAVRAFHELERWRDALVAGDAGVLEELAARFPAFDRAEALRLARAAARDSGGGRAPAAARKLFRYLAGFVDSA
ncbi:MAG: ribosome biogenesis factor YjgA [Gammaproteobacteria bacterium]